MKNKSIFALSACTLAATVAVAAARPEISWSIMHPTAIDTAYMKRVADKAVEYGGVDSFEVCGDCHSPYGGINGLSMLDPYPRAHALVDPAAVRKARSEMREICRIAHSIGKPLYYWHREVFIPKGLLEDLPSLKDEDGEFDLLGDTYRDYLRFKIDETFRHCPELDGVVLTLTEADFSVIHNSNPKRYPPKKVVEHLVRIFAEEHEKRGKRFILRSFGSNSQDYEDIIGGASRAARDHAFEIETKVTEADFVPWLPKNPFLKKNPPLRLGAECDALGEYLGAGYLPAAQVARIKEYVASAMEEDTDRFTIRIDRVGNSIFDSAHEVNLFAYMRFIRNPSLTADAVIEEYAKKRFGAAADEMVPIVKGELEMVRNLHYIASNLTFHTFPIKPNFRTLKAGGIFSVYRENASLAAAKDIWSILDRMRTPSHAQILAEKDLGISAAEKGLAEIERLKGKLPPEEYVRQHRAFRNAVQGGMALRAYTRCVVAYFEDMAAGKDMPDRLNAASEAAVREIESLMIDANDNFTGKGSHFNVVGGNIDRVYFIGLRFFCRELVREYGIERAMRKKLDGAYDFVIPGGIYDDNRVIRTMHGAYSATKDDRVVRFAGNPVFPNGTITVKLNAPESAEIAVALDPDGAQTCRIDKSWKDGVWTVTVGKKGVDYPGVLSIAAVRKSGGDMSRTAFSTNGDNPVNCLENSEFEEEGRFWKLEGGDLTVRCETSPMSRKWIVRTMGDTYRFLNCSPKRYERNTDYTLVVEARGVGGESQMNILEIYRRDGDGKASEGTQIARHLLLGESFHTYYLPFRSTDKGEPYNMVFYKWEPKNAADRGIEVASVRMFKGKVRALDIRRTSMDPRKAPVGNGVPLAANPYGRLSVPLRGLVFTLRLQERREILEAFEGTGIKADVLATSAPDQDIYYTDDDIEAIKGRVAKKEYDFFVVLSHVAGRIGPEMAEKVLEAVNEGSGLYFMSSPNKGHFDAALKGAGLRPLDAGNPIVASYPSGLGCGVENFNPVVLFREGRIGKGLVFSEGSGRTGAFKFTMNQKCYGETDFPYGSFADPLMIKILRSIARNGRAGGAPARTQWSAVDAWGMVRRSGEAADAESAFAQAKAQCDVSGRYAVALRSVDAQGATVDWCARYFDREGPRLELQDVRTSCSGDDPAVLCAMVEGGGAFAAIRWMLEDFSGRIIESGAAKRGEKFEVPTRALFTNKGVVWAYLEDGGKVLAVARKDIYARDRDWQRLSRDFTVGIWGQGSVVSRDTSPIIDRRLLDHGILYQCNPVDYFARNRNLTFSLASGMAVGGGYLGDSGWFFPKKLDASNVRSSFGPINTQKGRKRIAKLAKEHASGVFRYGPISYALCDEPNLCLRHTKNEPDEEPENIAEYRRRMERKYGTVAEYNRRHRTSHASFAEVGPMRIEEARSTGNFAEYVEWRNFNVDRWCEAIKTVADAGAEVDPTCRLSLFNSFGQTAASGNDYWKLLTKAGLGFSNEYTSMVYMRRNAIYNFDELYRSFRPDLRVWGFTGYALSEPQIRFTPWWFAAHRYGGFTWFSVLTWDWRYFDFPSLAYTKDAEDLHSALEKSRMLDGLGRVFLSCDWLPRQIAIYYSHESMLTSTLLGTERVSYDIAGKGPLHDYMYSRQGLQYIFEDLLCQFDFIAPEQVVTGGRLKDFKVVFMPRIVALSNAEVAKLKEFVAGGGRIVADQLPGDYDELGVKRASNPFRQSEVTVIGENFDDLSVAQRKTVLGLLTKAGAEPILRSEGVENVFGREAMHFTDGVNSLFIVLRIPMRSNDSETQTFTFPKEGHVYDVREGKYLGFTDSVTAAVPHAEASVWAVLPEKVGGMRISAPADVAAGRDLVADIALEGAAGKGVFHAEIVSPTGECRFHMKRNLDSKDGKARLAFRMARNDQPGKWTLRVTDAITGVRAEHSFLLQGSATKKKL